MTQDHVAMCERALKIKDDDIIALRMQLSRKNDNERKLESVLDDTRMQCESLKQKLMETADMLDDREHMLMIKADEIMDMQRILAESKEHEMKNLNMYEQ